MKIFKLLTITIIALTFTGCGALGFGGGHIDATQSVEGDHPLVGIWEWDDMDTYLYIFNADGNGSRGFAPLIQQFTWEVCEAGHLSMTLGNNTEHWYMTIEGNVLTITSRQVANMQYSYIRRAGS